ncbi:MAG TPA: hypothetical protein VFE51_09650 [Verrucomicrobiae bacterium]|nr:hypothetical protein [Verrucomicrobiae bacterium]
MTTWKIIQLVCMGIVWFMSPAFQIVNKKLPDHSKSSHRSFFWILAALWLAAGPLLAIATYKDFTKKEKSPVFKTFVNGLELTNGCWITIYTVSNSAPLELWTDNVGDIQANGVQLSINFPEHVTVNPPSGDWTPTAPFDTDSQTFQKVGLGYVSTFKGILDCYGNRITWMPPLLMESETLRGSVNKMLIQTASGSAQVPSRITFHIHFVNGNAVPRYGY